MEKHNDEIEDIESQLEPAQPADAGAGVPWGGLTLLVGVVLVVVFAVQNTEVTSVDFLWLTGEFPLSIVILVTAVFSALFAVTAGVFSRRRRVKRRAEKVELRRLRGED